MARPLKVGLDYFPHDVDASQDEKILLMEAKFGNDGYAFFFKMCERIYRTSGARLDISSPLTIKVLANYCKVREKKFNLMLKFSEEVELFSEEVEQNRKTISSRAIQRRANNVTRQRESRHENTEKWAQETPQITPQITLQETGESKVKESKVKESIYISDTPLPLKDTTFKEFTTIWEETCGRVSSISEVGQLKAMAETYPVDNFRRAVEKAKKYNKLSLPYVEAILKNSEENDSWGDDNEPPDYLLLNPPHTAHHAPQAT